MPPSETRRWPRRLPRRWRRRRRLRWWWWWWWWWWVGGGGSCCAGRGRGRGRGAGGGRVGVHRGGAAAAAFVVVAVFDEERVVEPVLRRRVRVHDARRRGRVVVVLGNVLELEERLHGAPRCDELRRVRRGVSHPRGGSTRCRRCCCCCRRRRRWSCCIFARVRFCWRRCNRRPGVNDVGLNQLTSRDHGCQLWYGCEGRQPHALARRHHCREVGRQIVVASVAHLEPRE